MIIRSTILMPFGGTALTSDDQLITAMVRPPGHPCGGDFHEVSDKMRHSASVREALSLGWITVEMDAKDSSDFVAQVELNALATLVSGFSGFSGTVGTKFVNLDFHGAADTEDIRVIDDVPFLKFKSNKTSRSIWTFSVPDDYVSGTAIEVEVCWSPENSDTGSIKWLLEHKSVPPGSSVGGSSSTSTLIQPAGGTPFELIKTGSALSVPAGSISSGDFLNLAVSRVGDDASDTYAGTARIHLVRVRYSGLRFTA